MFKFSLHPVQIIFILLVCVNAHTLQGQTYGLKFQGIEKTIDKRTELNLTKQGDLDFKDEFEIGFDYKINLQKQEGLFGYVFRLVNSNNANVDLVNNIGTGVNLNLVIGKSNSVIPIKIKTDNDEEWMELRLKLFLNEDRLVFYTPDSMYVHENIGFEKKDSFKLIFGANDYGQFKTSDVPPMSVRDIRITEKGKLKHHWRLDETQENIARDRINEIEAYVKNPLWLRQSHQTWKKLIEKEFSGILMVAPDSENERIFLLGERSFFQYDFSEDTLKKKPYNENPQFITSSYRAVYNKNDNKIYCYLVEGPPMYVLDIVNGKWNELGSPSKYKTKYLHHNSFFYPPENSIYVFGGYGRHTYNNEIRKINLNNKTWSDLPSNDSIFTPRYLSGLGALNDTLYFLGGYGSVSGNQLINPHSYFDFFGYSIKDSTLFRKFEIPHFIDDMVVSNSMYIDKKTRNYYSLVFEKTKFNGKLQLIKGNLDNKDIVPVGNRIPFKFLDIKSTAELFYMPANKKLFSYTTYLTDSNNTEFQLNSIDYPPNDVLTQKNKNSPENLFNYLIIGTIMLLFTGGVVFYFIKRKRRSNPITIQKPETEEPSEPKIAEVPTTSLIDRNNYYQLIFFGGFQAFDENGEDITKKFSPLLKELFLLIWLNTYDNGKGVSSEKITEELWFDKSERRARNNRAVNIAKLRNILTLLGDCELTKKTGYWKIIIDEKNIKSDYLDFLKITSSNSNLNREEIIELIKISDKGAFLSNVHYEWLDKFKAEVSDRIINTLVNFADKCKIEEDPEFIIHLADSIFNFDKVNEEAMIFKCKAQHYMGRHSLAKLTYENFIKEYRIIYDQEYELTFGEIINEN